MKNYETIKNKVNYIQAINFINLDETNETRKMKNEAQSRKTGSRFFRYIFWWLNFIYIEPKCESRSYFRSFLNH